MYSNVGFDDADIEKLGKTEGIDKIEGVTSIDVITNVHDNDETVQIFPTISHQTITSIKSR